MTENGLMIYNMVMELKHGLMDLNIKEDMKKVKSMVMDNIFGAMDQLMKEIG